MLLIAHSGDRDLAFTLPRLSGDGLWVEMIDTASLDRGPSTEGPIRVAAYSFLLLRYGLDRRMDPIHHAAAVNTAAVNPAEAAPAAAAGGATSNVDGGPNHE